MNTRSGSDKQARCSRCGLLCGFRKRARRNGSKLHEIGRTSRELQKLVKEVINNEIRYLALLSCMAVLVSGCNNSYATDDRSKVESGYVRHWWKGRSSFNATAWQGATSCENLPLFCVTSTGTPNAIEPAMRALLNEISTIIGVSLRRHPSWSSGEGLSQH